MKVTEVVASCTTKMNLGNYEATDLFLSAKAEVDELDTPESAMAELTAIVERAMVKRLVAAYAKRGINKDEAAVRKHHGLAGG